MKLGVAPRREFIPHAGDKHLLHHADPAVRHTRVRALRDGGRPRAKTTIWQAGQDEPSSRAQMSLARITTPTPQTGSPPANYGKTKTHKHTHTYIHLSSSQKHERMNIHLLNTVQYSQLLKQPAPRFCPAQPCIRPRATASPHKDLIPAGASALPAHVNTQGQQKESLGIPARHPPTSTRPTSSLGAESVPDGKSRSTHGSRG